MLYKVDAVIEDEGVLTHANDHWSLVVLNRVKSKLGRELAEIVQLYTVKEIRKTRVCGDFVFMSLKEYELIEEKLNELKTPENKDMVNEIINDILKPSKTQYNENGQ